MATAPWNVSAAGDPGVGRLRRLSTLAMLPGVVINAYALDHGPRSLLLVAMSLLLIGLGLSVAASIRRRRIEHAIWRSGVAPQGDAPRLP